MSEKKSANYYGGYSLYRGGNGTAAQPVQQLNQTHRQLVASTFNPDWLSAAMPGMMMPMMFPPPMAMATPAAVAPVLAAPADPKPAAGASKIPFFNNFFPATNFYRGTPVKAVAHPSNTKGNGATGGASPLASAAAPSAGRPVATSQQRASQSSAMPIHFSDTWNAFDAIAPAQRPAPAHHLDPIGTTIHARSSVWAGTPVADTPSAAALSSSSSSSSTLQRTFSVWSSPTNALKDTFSTTFASGAKPDAEDAAHERLIEKHNTKFASEEVNSDDEDWLEHLKTTLTTVLSADDSAVSAPQRVPSPQRKMDMEWAVRSHMQAS